MRFLFAFLLSLAASAIPASAAYPEKPIRIIVPFAPGGGVDNLARVVAEKLGTRLRQPVVIENKPGANANIGAEAAAGSPPDGYTLFMASTVIAANHSLFKTLRYDASRDFTAVARVARAPTVLVIAPALPVKNVAELVQYGKGHKLTYGSPGVGTTQHLNCEILKGETGIDALHVPYKGGAPALIDVMAGRVDFMMAPPSEVLAQIRAGKVTAIAVSGRDRLPQLPDVPTLAEAKLANPGQTIWWGLLAHAKTPQPIVEHLSREVLAIVADPDARKAIEQQGVEAAPMGATEFNAFFREELGRYAQLVRQFNIPAE
jgi:tripartite-type tricarboxylate transporter receptor subunit TctC